MKKYMMVTEEAANKVAGCFAGTEEVTTFASQLDGLVEEISFLTKVRERAKTEEGVYILLRQICLFGLYCREHMDLIHQVVSNLEFTEITEEELNKFKEE